MPDGILNALHLSSHFVIVKIPINIDTVISPILKRMVLHPKQLVLQAFLFSTSCMETPSYTISQHYYSKSFFVVVVVVYVLNSV